MKVFDLPGGMEAVSQFNAARRDRRAAQDAYAEARIRNWEALVRMAEAHKRLAAMVDPEEAGYFAWVEALDGNRDEILKGAAIKAGGVSA